MQKRGSHDLNAKKHEGQSQEKKIKIGIFAATACVYFAAKQIRPRCDEYKSLIWMNIQIEFCQQKYTNEYLNIFV